MAGKVVLITGGAGGIGLGARVGITGRDLWKGRKTLPGIGTGCQPLNAAAYLRRGASAPPAAAGSKRNSSVGASPNLSS